MVMPSQPQAPSRRLKASSQPDSQVSQCGVNRPALRSSPRNARTCRRSVLVPSGNRTTGGTSRVTGSSGDRTVGLKRQEFFVAPAELAQDLVRVLGELRGARQLRGLLVELPGTGHELALLAVGIGHLSEVAVGGQRP